MRIATSYILSLALLALFSSACTSPRVVTAPPLVSGAPTPQASDFPRGRFSAASAPNMVILAIENDGSFRIYLDNAMLDSGRFYVSGPQVLVESMTCAKEGAEAGKPAAYDWSYDEEDVLVFLPVVSDPCPERRQYLAEQYQPKYTFVFNRPDRGVSEEWLW